MGIPPVKALIPIRKHSKRVLNKNTKLFCGKPLYHWILQTLCKSQHIAEIVVDTDSEEIAETVKDLYSATVLMRPEKLCGYEVGIHPLIEFEISQATGEYFLQTHVTNPLLRPETVDNAIKFFFSQDAHDSLFTVTQLQTRLYWEDGKPLNHDPQNMLRTQDLPPIFEENSNFYLFSRTSFQKKYHRIGENPAMFPLDKLEAVDIDEEADFMLAEILMRNHLNKG